MNSRTITRSVVLTSVIVVDLVLTYHFTSPTSQKKNLLKGRERIVHSNYDISFVM